MFVVPQNKNLFTNFKKAAFLRDYSGNQSDKNDATDQVIKAMLMGKGASFPNRGISEISDRSAFSNNLSTHTIGDKIYPYLKQPQALRPKNDQLIQNRMQKWNDGMQA